MKSEEVGLIAQGSDVVDGYSQFPAEVRERTSIPAYRDAAGSGICGGIAVVDDDETVRRTVLLMLARLFENVELSTFSNADEALLAMQLCSIPVILLDIMMPGISGIDLARMIKLCYPKTRIVIMTGHSRPDYVREALEAGVMAFLLKPFSVADLQQAIVGAIDGRLTLSEGIRTQLFDGGGGGIKSNLEIGRRLSEQETTIVRMVAKGMTDREIAWELKISENTVKTHLKRLFRKLNVSCRAEAASRFGRLFKS